MAKEQPHYVNVHPHYEIFNGLLLLLLVLHVYWWVLSPVGSCYAGVGTLHIIAETDAALSAVVHLHPLQPQPLQLIM